MGDTGDGRRVRPDRAGPSRGRRGPATILFGLLIPVVVTGCLIAGGISMVTAATTCAGEPMTTTEECVHFGREGEELIDKGDPFPPHASNVSDRSHEARSNRVFGGFLIAIGVGFGAFYLTAVGRPLVQARWRRRKRRG